MRASRWARGRGSGVAAVLSAVFLLFPLAGVAVAATAVDATPEQDINPTGTSHRPDVVVTDGGAPMSGQVVRFRVTSGPHADNDLDAKDESQLTGPNHSFLG